MNRGIEKWVTPAGVAVLRLHYSADPDKDPETGSGRTWLANELSGYPDGMKGTKWRREMEIDFSIRGKSRVFPNWIEMTRSVVMDPIAVPEHWPIYMGYDYGYREPFAAVFLAFESSSMVYLVDEIYKARCSLFEQAQMIKRNPFWGRVRMIIGDPSIWHRTENVGVRVTTKGDLLREQGIHILKGRKEPGVDITFRDLLISTLWRDLEHPRFKIFSHCKQTIKEFKNVSHRDHISKGAQERNAILEEIISKHVNAWDAIKYVLLSQPIAKPENLPAPVGSVQALRRQLADLKRYRRNILQ